MSSSDILPKRPAPFDGESLMSWLYRLAQANYHNDMAHLYSLVMRSPKHIGRNININISLDDIQRLSGLTLYSVEDIYRLTAHSFHNTLCQAKGVLKSKEGDSFISRECQRRLKFGLRSKYCPACLQQDHFHRLHWDITTVTVCLEHRTLLRDHCSICGNPVTTQNIVSAVHKCGANLVQQPGEKVYQTDCQEYIQNKLGIWNKKNISARNRLPSLDEPAKLRLLEQIALAVRKLGERFELPFRYPDIDRTKIPVKPLSMMPISLRHVVLEDAFSILTNWPTRFYQLLDLFLKFPGQGVTSVLWCIRGIFLLAEDADFGQVKQALQDYYRDKSTTHKFSCTGTLYKIGLDAHELGSVTTHELATKLKMSQRHVERLLKKEGITIMYTSEESRRFRIKLVKRQDVERFIYKYEKRVTIKRIAIRLKIRLADVHDLLKSKMLAHVSLVINQAVLVTESALSAFEQKYIRKWPIADTQLSGRLIDIFRVCQLLGLLNWRLPKVLHLIDEQVLIPMRLESEHGLASLVFAEAEVLKLSIYCDGEKHWFREQEKTFTKRSHRVRQDRPISVRGREREITSYISMKEAAKLIISTGGFIRELAKCGLLKVVERKKRDGSNSKKIVLESFLKFRTKYVSRLELCKITGIRIKYLRSYHIAGRIVPVHWTEGNAWMRTLYLREDAERLSRNNCVSTSEAAAILGVKQNVIYRLISAGKLNPYSSSPGPTLRNRPHFFSRREVEQIKSEAPERITMQEMMELSGLSRYQVTMMMRKGILKPVSGPSVNGSDRYIFFRNDVKDITRLYSTRDAALFLSLCASTVRNLVRDGLLRASAGPTIDQNRTYKFRFDELNEFKSHYGVALDLLAKQRGLRLMGLSAVAKELRVKKACSWSLIRQGVIKPFLRVRRRGGLLLLFRRSDVQRIKKKYLKGLVSATDAARTLGEDLKVFKNRWLNTGILKPVRRNIGIEKMHFKKMDIKWAKILKAQCITGPMAAKMLGVHRTKVLKWTKEGRLHAVTGPDIDGYGCYLYMRKYVEKFRRDREKG
ncbi:MAG: helix-turn-helix domain-containing protein [Nitrospiraceae bacterium]|nr:helix-turn-helix domain-containing protein [Nitrospiraceae bacterium]